MLTFHGQENLESVFQNKPGIKKWVEYVVELHCKTMYSVTFYMEVQQICITPDTYDI